MSLEIAKGVGIILTGVACIAAALAVVTVTWSGHTVIHGQELLGRLLAGSAGVGAGGAFITIGALKTRAAWRHYQVTNYANQIKYPYDKL